MKKYLDVEHYLGIYKLRLKMFEEGIINPTDEGKEIIRTIIEKLSKMPLEEQIILDNHKMKDTKGNIIIEFLK